MPANIVKSVFPLDFIKNDLTFDISGTPCISKGKKSISKFKIAGLPAVGQKFYIEFEGKSLAFTVKNNSTIAANEAYSIINFTETLLVNELVKKIALNYYISLLYDVSITADLTITFTAKEPGTGNVTLKDIFNIDLNQNDPSITFGSPVVLRENYKIFGRFIIRRYFNENIQEIKTQPIFLSLNENNQVKIPVEILRSYFENIDVPLAANEFHADILKYAYIKAELEYAEYYENTIHLVKKSSPFYLLNAASLDSFRNVNQGDWIDPIDSSMVSKSTRARAFGSDSGKCIKTFFNCPQYAYFYYFNIEQSNLVVKSLNITVKATLKDGSFVNKSFTFEIKNFDFVRIPLSPKGMGISNHSDIIEYFVKVFPSGFETKAWNRKFVIVPEPFHSKIFLFQNRYGVLESFFTEAESFEKTLSGDLLIKTNSIEIDRSVEKTFICKTGPKTADEMQLLSDALDSKFNFMLINKSAVPITILPESFMIKNESEFFVEAEFKYRVNLSEVNRDLQISRNKEIISLEGIPSSDTVYNEESIVLNRERTNKLI
ncbi:MAG: hypothetical protein CVU04_03985 [Bacteroidetes bacterium HGW-Bacteroidetes-20]|nr:MAG: hypothetical protein CVU04_03985 [Bacteroidetes bacterium HGW-Bacteroidetes-20]